MMRTLCITYLCILLIVVGSRNVKTIAQDEVAVSSIGWSPDGSKLAVGYVDGQIGIVDTTTDAVLQVYSEHTGRIIDFVWDPSAGSSVLASASLDGTIRIWDSANQSSSQSLHTLSHDDSVIALFWIPDENLLWSFTEFGPQAKYVWDLSTWTLSHREDIIKSPIRILDDPNSDRILTLIPRGDLLIQDLANPQFSLSLTQSIDAGKDVSSAAWHPTKAEIFVVGDITGNISIWDLGISPSISVTLAANDVESGPDNPHLDNVEDIIFSENGDFLYAISGDGTFGAWHTSNWRLAYSDHVGYTLNRDTARFSPDGTRLRFATGSDVIEYVVDVPE